MVVTVYGYDHIGLRDVRFLQVAGTEMGLIEREKKGRIDCRLP